MFEAHRGGCPRPTSGLSINCFSGRADGPTGGAHCPLKRALELDPQHADTRAALARISAHAFGTSARLQPLKLAPASPALRSDLEALAKRYAVPPR